MKARLAAFLEDLDATLAQKAIGQHLDLYHIGRSALVWEYDYLATTEDVDVLRPDGEEELVALALDQFGKGTKRARQHGLYLEVVELGFPPVPSWFRKRAKMVAGAWKVIRLYQLEPHDLAATKLTRFSAKDQGDVRLLCDLGLLDSAKLEESLNRAYLWSTDKDGDPYRDEAFANLRQVQAYLRGEGNL
jgi:hypothetical protein